MNIVSAEYRVLLGTIGYVVGLLVLILSGFAFYTPNATIAVGLISMSSGLISAGIFKKKVKEHTVD